MAFTFQKDLLAAAETTFCGQFFKLGVAPTSTAALPGPLSLMYQPGFPGQGNPVETVATACGANTSGALPVPAAASGKSLFLASFNAQYPVGDLQLTLMDRAAHIWAIDMAAPSTRTINLAVPARLSTSTGSIRAYLEVASPLPSPSQAVITYTNSSGVTGRTSAINIGVSTTGTGVTGSFITFPLQSGDLGVSSVQTIQVYGNYPGQPGNLGVVLARSIMTLNNNATLNSGLALAVNMRSTLIGLTDLGTSPCLFLTALSKSLGNTSAVRGSYTIVQG